jgi:hypothetical protein
VADPRDEYVGRVVAGKSFADIGGLWGTVNEKCSVAHRHGANDLAMIDRVDEQNGLWRQFEERRRELSLPPVRCISSELVELSNSPDPPVFDVVHCSGVLYHIPNPVQILVALRKITREHLVLASCITATTVKSELGTLTIPAGAALFVPALRGREREIVNAHWAKTVSDNAIGLTRELPKWDPEDLDVRRRGLYGSSGFALLERQRLRAPPFDKRLSFNS